MAGYFFIWQGIYLPKDSQNTEKRLFEVNQGQGLLTISENLAKEKLIKNKLFFQIYIILKGQIKKLQAGTYSLSPAMNIRDIGQKISQGENIKIKITIPEGFTIEQIQNEFNSKLDTELNSNIKSQNLESFKNEFAFLDETPNNTTLEGFLFPDTYFFEPDIQEIEIVKIFLRNFDKKLTEELRQEITKQGKTIFDIITMASLLEKEVKSLEHKKLVSGILWKRMRSGMPLQIDATITFITGKKTTKVSLEETRIDSPYNTYKYTGLPIGPICNPGIESIIAAIRPQSNDFWYYLSAPDGETIFSKTLQEHNIAKAKYLSR